jgi:hypothetical protein
MLDWFPGTRNRPNEPRCCRCGFAVAHPGVDEHGVSREMDQPGMDALRECTRLGIIGAAGKKAAVLFQRAGIEIRVEDRRDTVRQRDFVNPCHRGSANLVYFVGVPHTVSNFAFSHLC